MDIKKSERQGQSTADIDDRDVKGNRNETDQEIVRNSDGGRRNSKIAE